MSADGPREYPIGGGLIEIADWILSFRSPRLRATRWPDTSVVQIYDEATGDEVTRFSYAALARVALEGKRGGLERLLAEATRGWFERIYDYNPRADGLWEGDTL